MRNSAFNYVEVEVEAELGKKRRGKKDCKVNAHELLDFQCLLVVGAIAACLQCSTDCKTIEAFKYTQCIEGVPSKNEKQSLK